MPHSWSGVILSIDHPDIRKRDGIKGSGQSRTDDGGFAIHCLATWLRSPE